MADHSSYKRRRTALLHRPQDPSIAPSALSCLREQSTAACAITSRTPPPPPPPTSPHGVAFEKLQSFAFRPQAASHPTILDHPGNHGENINPDHKPHAQGGNGEFTRHVESHSEHPQVIEEERPRMQGFKEDEAQGDANSVLGEVVVKRECVPVGDKVKSEANSELGEMIPGACETLLSIADELVVALAGLKFAPPVTCVYNPLVYARDLHAQYIRKHGGRRVKVLLVGMNPGPFGMAQTGVPFGDGKMVQDFHGIRGKVGTPVLLHSKRPIYGLECPRQEVSGKRLWGWARDRFGSASNFFQRFWVYNYCPLVFMEASGKNRTPDKLQPVERASLKNACSKALIQTVTILKPEFVVGIGRYAADRIRECSIAGITVGEMMHPSPANPKANKDWAVIIEAQLQALGLALDC